MERVSKDIFVQSLITKQPKNGGTNGNMEMWKQSISQQKWCTNNYSAEEQLFIADLSDMHTSTFHVLSDGSDYCDQLELVSSILPKTCW